MNGHVKTKLGSIYSPKLREFIYVTRTVPCLRGKPSWLYLWILWTVEGSFRILALCVHETVRCCQLPLQAAESLIDELATLG